MKPYFYTCCFLALSFRGVSCISCNKNISEGIYNSRFYSNLLTMLSAFIVLGLITALLSYLALRRTAATQQRCHPLLAAMVPLGTASMVIGIGVGGFTDGIVLHQLLQWHNMLSAKIPATTYEGKSINMFWDGIFHAFTLLVTLTGFVLLWRLLKKKEAINTSGYLMSGGLFFGWALFNLTEGIIDHHLLHLHHVRETADADPWNYGFLLLSVLMLLLGLLLMRLSVNRKSRDVIMKMR